MCPKNVVVKTPDVLSSKTQYIGMMKIILTSHENKNLSYDIAGFVYDPETTINLIGIPFLRDYFGRKDKISNLDGDGTCIK